MGFRDNALRALRDHLKENPRELTRVLRNALGLRASIPLGAFRWLADQAEATEKVKHLHISFIPPGVRFVADVDAMDTPLRVSATVFFEKIALSDSELTLGVRLENVELDLTGDADTPVAALIKSGALDLSNPGTLVGYMAPRTPVVVAAEGSRIVVDLMRDPKLSKNPLVHRVVGLLTPFLTIHGIETDGEHLDVVMRAFPRGYLAAASAVNRHVVQPTMKRYLPALAR